MSQDLDHFIDLRDSMRQERIGSGGREVCESLTHALDEAIRNFSAPLPSSVALVALGGYGRQELSPFSDVDLMVLHETEDASAIAAEVFRPLWDARFKVGHSVRTVEDAAAAAKDRVETHTTLLTARLVAGDDGIYQALLEKVAAVTRARPLRRHLLADQRRRRDNEPHLLMATDVKEGRGGLRTLQGFAWERRREALIGRFSGDMTEDEQEAYETLLAIRNGLHLAAGRSHDVFSTDLREPVARWLDQDVYETARSLISATQTVDRLAAGRWPEVVDDPTGPLGRRIWARLSGRPDPLKGDRPPTIAEINWILETGEQGRIAFERLWDEGQLDEVLPEWDSVRCEPQLAPFHMHPVDAHLWRTVEEMRALTTDGGKYRTVADRLDMPEVLSLCAFLHDIGKGHGGDHARVGAGIARSFCDRLGFDSQVAELIEGSVRYHLLLAETATRRDLDDPAVIEEVATQLGSARLLRIVFLLTVADSKATGPTMWSDWKETLLETLYERCLAWLGPSDEETATITQDDVFAIASPSQRPLIRSHLGGLPGDYLRSLTPESVLWHVELIGELSGRSNIGVRASGPVETAVVVGPMTGGFRRSVAAVFAANGIDVVEARLFTRSDGMVVDSFQVLDDRTGDTVRPERWHRAREDLEAALAGDLDTFSKVEARAASYPAPELAQKPSARCSVDPATGDLVVAIRCSDRIGRLAEILDVMARAGLEIRLAKLDSRGDQLVDTFHVRSGSEVRREELDDLGRLIAESITP